MKAQARMVSLLGVAAVGALAMTVQLVAQDTPQQQPKQHQYKLQVVGTFGGPNSYAVTGPANSRENYFNRQGGTVGAADTSMADPFNPSCLAPDCFATHAFTFQNGILKDLGALSGGVSSLSIGINNAGLVAGASENGSTDPATGYPEYHAVVWRQGTITDLGTLGGSLSQALAVNNRGQVVGVAANAIPDPYANLAGIFVIWTATTQQRAFLWQGGALQDLGTLGGNDAVAYFVNDRGQVAGVSYTNTTPNGTTGFPTLDPFLWDRDEGMVDLGSLGGAYGIVSALNNRGQVAGYSDLAGDQVNHAFLWDRGVLTDLGTLGGSNSGGDWLNDRGDVVGGSYTAGDQTVHGVLWRHGAMTDLGTLPRYNASGAFGINASGTIVGVDCDSLACQSMTAYVWENGSMADLNTLVTPPSNVYVYGAFAIADSGEILASGTLPNGDSRFVVLTPNGDCDDDCEQRIAESRNHPQVAQPATRPTMPAVGKPADWLRNRLGVRFPFSGRTVVPSN